MSREVWSAERIETASKLWCDGYSATQIARQLGIGHLYPDGGRSAVIGKMHRLRVAKGHKRSTGRTYRKPRQVKTPKPMKANFGFPAGGIQLPEYVPEACFGPDLVIPEAERQTIATLEQHHCRWAFGDPQQPDFHFCGKDKVAGKSFCEFHVARAFQAPQVRRPGRKPLPLDELVALVEDSQAVTDKEDA